MYLADKATARSDVARQVETRGPNLLPQRGQLVVRGPAAVPRTQSERAADVVEGASRMRRTQR